MTLQSFLILWNTYINEISECDSFNLKLKFTVPVYLLYFISEMNNSRLSVLYLPD